MAQGAIERLSEQCPLCGAPVSQSRFAQLQEHVRQEERRKLEVAVATMRTEMEAEYQGRLKAQAAAFTREKQDVEEERRKVLDAERALWEVRLKTAEEASAAATQAAKGDSAKLRAEFAIQLAEERDRVGHEVQQQVETELASANTEKGRLAGLLAQAEQRQLTLVAEVSGKEERLRGEFAQVLEQETSAAVERGRSAGLAEVERLKQERVQLNERVAQLQGKEKEIQARYQAEKDVAVAEANRQYADDVLQVRTALAKDRDDQLRLLNQQRIAEQQRWQAKVTELQRSLEKKTANELGEWPEIDVYQSLQEAFRDDRIRRVGKGEEGADVIMEVLYRGEVCGRIVVDSKNRKSWQNRFAEKLREDRDAAKADHAILATSVFPRGERDLCLRNGVVIVRAQSVVALVQMLREFVVRSHVQGLSVEQRTEKAARLYEYLTSEAFRQRFTAARHVGEQLEDLDVEEKKAHDKLWERRGTLHRQLGRSLGEIHVQVGAIVEGTEPAQTQIA